MNIFLYAGKKGGAGESRLATLIDNSVTGSQPYRADNPPEMIELLRSRMHSQDIVILHLATARELDDFLAAQSLFDDIRLLLILPDNNPALLTKSHELRPRFVDIDQGDNFDRVMAVLNKMCILHPPRSKLKENAQKNTEVKH